MFEASLKELGSDSNHIVLSPRNDPGACNSNLTSISRVRIPDLALFAGTRAPMGSRRERRAELPLEVGFVASPLGAGSAVLLKHPQPAQNQRIRRAYSRCSSPRTPAACGEQPCSIPRVSQCVRRTVDDASAMPNGVSRARTDRHDGEGVQDHRPGRPVTGYSVHDGNVLGIGATGTADDERDVVRAAAVERELQQLVADLLRRSHAPRCVGDLVVATRAS